MKAQKFPEKAKQREIECIMIYSLSCLAPLGNERAALELETEAHVVAAVEFAGIIVAQMYLNAVSSARPIKVHDYCVWWWIEWCYDRPAGQGHGGWLGS